MAKKTMTWGVNTIIFILVSYFFNFEVLYQKNVIDIYGDQCMKGPNRFAMRIPHSQSSYFRGSGIKILIKLKHVKCFCLGLSRPTGVFFDYVCKFIQL